MANCFDTYLSLKERLEDDGGVVVQYKDFVVTAEWCTGPRGEWFTCSVYGLLDDPEEFDIDFFHCRLSAMAEDEGEYETEGEALAAAFRLCDTQFLPQKEVM